jgi:hypothetical protein
LGDKGGLIKTDTRFWNNHKSYRFTLPQTLFNTQTAVEDFGSLLKAATLTVRYCLGAIKETAGFFMVCDLTF